MPPRGPSSFPYCIVCQACLLVFPGHAQGEAPNALHLEPMHVRAVFHFLSHLSAPNLNSPGFGARLRGTPLPSPRLPPELSRPVSVAGATPRSVSWVSLRMPFTMSAMALTWDSENPASRSSSLMLRIRDPAQKIQLTLSF